MALSRAQHEANKANGAYHIDRHGNRVAPALRILTHDAVASVTIIAKQFCRQSLRSLSLKLPACRLLVQPSGYES